MVAEAGLVLALIFAVARWAARWVVLGPVLLSLCFGLSVLRYGQLEVPVWGAALWTFIAAITAALGWGLRREARVRADAHRARMERELALQRVRVARDLHDFVGHDVSELVAFTQVAPLLSNQPDRLESVLASIERAGQRSLENLDVAVSALHDPDPPRPGAGLVPTVVARFNAGREEQIRWLDETGDRMLPSAESALVYRTVLEALTNIRRHAPGSTGCVRLSVTATRVRLVVTDTGTGAAEQPVPRSGPGRHGLANLRTQASELDGRLETGPAGSGWRVCLELPLETP